MREREIIHSPVASFVCCKVCGYSLLNSPKWGLGTFERLFQG